MREKERLPDRHTDPRSPWRVPVVQADVPQAGLHFDLVADEGVRAAVAELAGVAALPRLDASFDVSLHGRGGLHVSGRVSATVGQICSVTLEPIENEVSEGVDLVFVPAAAEWGDRDEGREVQVSLEDAQEPLINGTVDLGALATEFLILGIDPYPRKSGSVFQAPAHGEDAARPFSVLAALKERGRGGGQAG
jgi:Large ribosomal RNA subunit accumulation protein YceD